MVSHIIVKATATAADPKFCGAFRTVRFVVSFRAFGPSELVAEVVCGVDAAGPGSALVALGVFVVVDVCRLVLAMLPLSLLVL